MTNEIQNKSKNEEIEGLDISEDSLGDYPIDTLLIRNEHRTIYDVLRRIEQNSFIMNPEFQRDFVWSEDKQSKLIESVLMRIPLPVFYLAEDEQGRMIVVDGLQRLTTFRRFVNNELRLKFHSMDEHSRGHELENKCFRELPPKLQNRIEDFTLTLYIIDAKVPERARLDIFERVNSGVLLTRQQMRNSLYMGKATRFLKEEASSDLFLLATGNGLKAETMRDREFVNRFCAFQLLDQDTYRGDMDGFLAQALKKMNSLNSENLIKLSLDFRRGLTNNFKVFGKYSFRKHSENAVSRSVINASLWDVMTTGLSSQSESTIEEHKDQLRYEFYGLMNNEYFVQSISYATNDIRSVNSRFYISRMMFEGVFGANPN